MGYDLSAATAYLGQPACSCSCRPLWPQQPQASPLQELRCENFTSVRKALMIISASSRSMLKLAALDLTTGL